MWEARASGRKNSFLNRWKARNSMISGVYNIIFMKNVSTCDKLRNMVLRISQHCTLWIRSWVLFRALDRELCDCRERNTFARHLCLPPLLENVVLLCEQASQLMVCLWCAIFEHRILPQVPELRSVESRKEQLFRRFAVGIVCRHYTGWSISYRAVFDCA